MNAGLPGTGLGGLFYLLSALLMPILELVRVGRQPDRPGRWQSVARQLGLCVGIIAALWGTGLLLGLVLVTGDMAPAAAHDAPADDPSPIGLLVGAQAVLVGLLAQPLLVGLATLGLIVLTVEAVGRVAGAVPRRADRPLSSS